jgi:hypothetical protein
MGGNALSEETIRLPASRYREVENRTLGRIRDMLPGVRAEAIAAYTDKPDFGDMDILVAEHADFEPIALSQKLAAKEIVRNGEVTSFGLPVTEGVFQVDLISVPAASFDFAMRYFSFNDLGNLLGRVAHKFGAKFGHLGLLYPLRDPENDDHLLAELPVTSDFSAALAMLGYDAQAYETLRREDQFRGLEDIFRYVVSSPYANPAIYLLENRSYRARVRDAKRPTYNKFLEWLAAQEPGSLPDYPWGEAGSPERQVQRRSFLDMAFERFPAFKNSYDEALAGAERLHRSKRYFNGEFVASISGLSGKELGMLMSRIRATFASNDELEGFFAAASEDEARERIRSAIASIHDHE